MNLQQYFKEIDKKTMDLYSIAEEARSKGFDPKPFVETPLAKSLAEKVVGLISAVYPQVDNPKIVERILELEKDYGKLDPMVAFKIAEEVAKQKYCKFSTLIEAIEAGARVGFSYITLGVVSSPIEGFTRLETGKTKDGKEYFKAYYSGPIRAAGTTASCMSLILIDYLRELFGFAKYDQTEEEVQRYVTEMYDYHDRITNLQYIATPEEILFLARRIPIQIDGEPTEKMEVSNYKNLERIDTNRVRGGMCLCFSEGMAQKAAKGLRLLNSMKKRGLKCTGFDFLDEYVKLHEQIAMGHGKEKKTDTTPVYIKDLVAGRPIFGHPSRSGAFRFRYGRGRTSGFSAFSLHPATMQITDGFIATGTQLKTEKPTKGGIVTSCDSIDGPTVKLYNGTVKRIYTSEEAKKIYPEVEEIIYLGDILFPFSDVLNRNFDLLKPGYVEEIWKLELREKNTEAEKGLDYYNVNFEDAVKISRENKISLHPNHIFYWTEISKEQFKGLLDWLKYSKADKKLILPYSKTEKERFSVGKRAMELLGVEHEVFIDHVVLNLENSKALLANLGIDWKLLDQNVFLKEVASEIKSNEEKTVLENINSLSEFKIRNKAGEFIGSRMGRPEKGKLRKLTGSPNVLFPVGKEGGRLRSFQAAAEVGFIRSEFPAFWCEECKKETIYPSCEVCSSPNKKMFYCWECKETSLKPCEKHEKSKNSYYQSIDINYYLKSAKEKVGFATGELPPLIKGIRGTSSDSHALEHLSKGILRAKHDLQVNKDGTIRFDITEMPLVSFKPHEICVSIEKLKEMGYGKDIYGKELVDQNQILELKPHDILLPSSPDNPEARADDVFMRVCNFMDDLLVRLYGMKPFYNVKKREDLVGKMGVCMAPHNVAGVVCRFIGFSKTLGGFASPYMHAAIRRDCDGDEMAIMLLGDVLLNFSRNFLPSHRGGNQDAPLVLNGKIDAGEVDDAILDFELVYEYPLELYRLAEQRKHSSEVKIYDVRQALAEGKNPLENVGFTHDTFDINDGTSCSSYKTLETMQDKVEHQMKLVEKIRAVDTSDTARLVIERHFLRDLRGNLRKFSQQSFRCVGCNEILRRPPLSGSCPRCRGKIIFTTHEGGIKKYLEPALSLAKRYDLSTYLKQNLELTKRFIDSVFGKELETQEDLGKWFG